MSVSTTQFHGPAMAYQPSNLSFCVLKGVAKLHTTVAISSQSFCLQLLRVDFDLAFVF